MKNILYILLAISITSCNNSKKVETAQSYAATPNGLADLQKSAAATKTTVATTSNLLTNPEHGQPGHDCSIAVGAPLKTGSKTNSAVTQQAQPNVQTVTTQSSTQPTTTNSGKLNPAHGQPGHDCAVAVGAPLGSKTVQTATNNAAPKVNVSQPATTSATPVLNEKGKRLNPAHGQPGHDCAVAVGAPLT
ncbi:MAG: hypothetical protein EOO47_03505 [Flavobacterium sp.]|nr:MAG: hypothetical protein EOO47_03505 [Flavobacterium sp.]